VLGDQSIGKTSLLLGIADAAGLALTSENFFSAEYSVLPFCFLLDQIARVRSEPFPSIF